MYVYVQQLFIQINGGPRALSSKDYRKIIAFKWAYLNTGHPDLLHNIWVKSEIISPMKIFVLLC